MNFTESDYKRIVNIKDTDDAFDEMMGSFGELAECYKKFKETKDYESLSITDLTSIKTSSYFIFKSLRHCMTIDDSELKDFNEEELSRYNDINSNIDIVTDTIKDCDLNDKESVTYKSLVKIFEHFELMNKDMNQLNQTMMETNKLLEESTILLQNQIKLNDLISSIENITFENCKDNLEWCQDTLKGFDNVLVNEVEEYIKNGKCYVEDYKNDNYDKDNLKDLNDKIFIQKVLKTLHVLEVKFDKLRLQKLSDNVKNNNFDEITISSDIKWCKKLLVPYDKADVLQVISDFTNGNQVDYKANIMKALENNDSLNVEKYKKYIEIFNITNIIVFLEMKQKTLQSNN